MAHWKHWNARKCIENVLESIYRKSLGITWELKWKDLVVVPPWLVIVISVLLAFTCVSVQIKFLCQCPVNLYLWTCWVLKINFFLLSLVLTVSQIRYQTVLCGTMQWQATLDMPLLDCISGKMWYHERQPSDSFFQGIVDLWNAFPVDIKIAKSICSFKEKLKSLIIQTEQHFWSRQYR